MWLTCLINLFQTNLPEDGNGEVELTHETEHLSSPDIEVSSHLSPRPFIFNQSTHVSFIDGYLGELYCLTIPKFCLTKNELIANCVFMVCRGRVVHK
jgi:hypothetical protein